MIVGSLLLILVAAGLLVTGLIRGSNVLLVSSIAASLLAAVALYAGARQARADRAYDSDGEYEEYDDSDGDGFDDGEEDGGAEPPPVRSAPVEAARGVHEPAEPVPAKRAVAVLEDDSDNDGDDLDEDPADEPAAQRVSTVDAARVALLRTEVLVVDARPRYHLPDCAHLRGRKHEPLPVGEAVELGFTPCGLCEPDTALLAETRPG